VQQGKIMSVLHNSTGREARRSTLQRAGQPAVLLAVLLLSACSPSPTPVATQANSTAASGTAAPVEMEPTASQSAAQLPATDTPAPDDVNPTAVQPAAQLPDCSSPAVLTPALTEGPYFKANSPERANLLEDGMPGTQLILTGYVLTTDCQPVAGALLDFWQADANGQYDNSGYTLRGHQFTDENGYYQLITVVPGEYPGRTEHIHFKVQAPNGPVLTSQLFFPDVQDNQSDRIFDQSLVIDITQDNGDSLQASFNFIITP